MTVLVTGAAGFIGFHVADALLRRGEDVVGLDSLDNYYDARLKQARLAALAPHRHFTFVQASVADRAAIEALPRRHGGIDRIVHLAAQAGVRHSIDQPRAYIAANITGQLEILECARHLPGLRHLVYASSSSVYGDAATAPFGLDDPCDRPRSLYAATKRADELMSVAYSHLYAIPATGLRFFTVYGPWGRPDMAPMLFARAILEGRPIRLYNGGDMRRDFTFIDDIVAGVLAALDRPPAGAPPHRLYNLGNDRPILLPDFVAALETACGRTASVTMEPMQPGDVRSTHADISAARRDLGFHPRVGLDDGLAAFIQWLRPYYSI